MKVGVADYGLQYWDGGCYDLEQRLSDLKRIGYEGIEQLRAHCASDAMEKAALYRRSGMDFCCCSGPEMDASIRWTAALGKKYVWPAVSNKPGSFENLCKQVNIASEAAARWGVRVALHNHLGTLVETEEQLDRFMERCPRAGLIYDTAHMAAAGGDALDVAARYAERICVVHVKDWLSTDPDREEWWERGRFLELGAGNIGLDNAAIVEILRGKGYEGWLLVEHDWHRNEPLDDLAVSREYLRQAGV